MLKYLKLDIKVKKDSNFRVPIFIGSMIRGAFGFALKRVVCINPKYNCSECAITHNCLFYKFYENKNQTPKFRFEFGFKQDNLDFSIYLFEEIIESVSYVINAINLMLTSIGLSKDRVTFDIEAIYSNDKSIYKNGEFNLDFTPKILHIDKISPDVKIKFLTPLRIKQNGRLSSNPQLKTILVSIQNRFNELKNIEKFERLNFTHEEMGSNFTFIDIDRYSNRQQTKMKFGGVIGEIEVKNLTQDEFTLLKLGEILGAGKSTVFGLGKMVIEPIDKFDDYNDTPISKREDLK